MRSPAQPGWQMGGNLCCGAAWGCASSGGGARRRAPCPPAAAAADPAPTGAGVPDIGAPLLEAAQAFEPKAVQLGFVAGTIPVEKLAPFERLLFRATRGNMFLKFTPVGACLLPARPLPWPLPLPLPLQCTAWLAAAVAAARSRRALCMHDGWRARRAGLRVCSGQSPPARLGARQPSGRAPQPPATAALHPRRALPGGRRGRPRQRRARGEGGVCGAPWLGFRFGLMAEGPGRLLGGLRSRSACRHARTPAQRLAARCPVDCQCFTASLSATNTPCRSSLRASARGRRSSRSARPSPPTATPSPTTSPASAR